jgi:hypothetical protein
MTSAEHQQLAAIERHLTAECPEWVQAFTGDARRHELTHHRRWAWAGVSAVLAGLVLLLAGAALGVAALAVTGLCPPLTYLVLAAAERHGRARARRPDAG